MGSIFHWEELQTHSAKVVDTKRGEQLGIIVIHVAPVLGVYCCFAQMQWYAGSWACCFVVYFFDSVEN